MKIGERLIYNKRTGKILNGTFDERIDSTLTEEMLKNLRPKEIDFIDLPFDYNDNNFHEAVTYHIDITKDKETTELKDLIIIDEYMQHIETAEERLSREKVELENKLLLQADNSIGGIL